MKSQQSKYPAMVKLCAAAVLGLGAGVAGAGVPTDVPAAPVAQRAAVPDQTDRIIVKYRDESGPVTVKSGQVSAARAAAPLSTTRKAIVDRAGQQYGMLLKESHSIATGARIFKLDR